MEVLRSLPKILEEDTPLAQEFLEELRGSQLCDTGLFAVSIMVLVVLTSLETDFVLSYDILGLVILTAIARCTFTQVAVFNLEPVVKEAYEAKKVIKRTQRPMAASLSSETMRWLLKIRKHYEATNKREGTLLQPLNVWGFETTLHKLIFSADQ